jgi:hypothetical protein
MVAVAAQGFGWAADGEWPIIAWLRRVWLTVNLRIVTVQAGPGWLRLAFSGRLSIAKIVNFS